MLKYSDIQAGVSIRNLPVFIKEITLFTVKVKEITDRVEVGENWMVSFTDDYDQEWSITSLSNDCPWSQKPEVVPA